MRSLLTILALVALSVESASARETCLSPGGSLPSPSAECRFRTGTTDDVDPSRVYTVELTGGVTYVFSLCDATCGGADADFDSLLLVHAPDCTPLMQQDDSCGPRSELRFTATQTGTHAIEVTGSDPDDTGDFVLAYYRECSAGPADCGTPVGRLESPRTTCQSVSGSLACGSEEAWVITLVQGQRVTFTTCPTTCPGAGAGFDTQLELHDPTGAVVALGDPSCGNGADLVHETDPLTGGGDYCIKVLGPDGAGAYTMGYRVACQPPSSLGLSPLLVGAVEQDCSVDRLFTITAAGTAPFDFDWSISPDVGNTAVPSTGSITSTSNTANFASSLSGVGTYLITVDASNDCGLSSETFVVVVEDRRAPDLVTVATSVECGEGAASGVPRRIRSELGSLERSERSTAPITWSVDTEASTHANDLKAARSTELQRTLDGRAPGLRRPPQANALDCATPCVGATLEQDHAQYDVFLNCSSGAFTARTGASHAVTLDSGAAQNVIFGGQFGSPGTSDIMFRLHDLGVTYQNPTGGMSCSFDPPDTPREPNNVGLEQEWVVSPVPGVDLVLRQEIVAFGSSDADSGIRLTLGITNMETSEQAVRTGVGWQIDYQNAGDDGPLFATVTCSPPEVVEQLAVEHELLPDEIHDFYRIQNNTGTPIFSNFTNTTALEGFPGTGTPDRLVYGGWTAMRGAPWDYVANEGSVSPDFDSAVLYYFGYRPADGIVLAPGESSGRSVVVLTSSDNVDCGAFIPGAGTNVDLEVCKDDCASLTAHAADGCGEVSTAIVDSSAGAPPCPGIPCDVQFADPGTYTYTYEATDASGNVTRATTTVRVADCAGGGCTPSIVGSPGDSWICLGESSLLDASGLGILGCEGSVAHEWRKGAELLGSSETLLVSPTETTTYTVSVRCSSDATCDYEESVTVFVEAPPVAGPATARKLAECNTGIEVSWAAADFGLSSGVYNVYRGEGDCADALAGPPLVAGLTGLSWVDGTTSPGRTYVYVVQAETDAAAIACAPPGPHHGGVVDQACTEPVLESGILAFPDGVHATLRVAHVGDEVTLNWPLARSLIPGEHFHLLKATWSPVRQFAQVNAEASTSRTHRETDTSAPIQFFDLRVADACEVQSLDEYPPGY